MRKRVRLGLVGLGWWGGVLADAVNRSDHAELSTCFARTPETLNAFAKKYECRASPSLHALLEDDHVDGVLFATPHSLHREHIELAAAAGVHTFVEKPFTLTSEEGRAAIAAAESAGIHLMVGHQRRRQTANRELRAMVDSGEIGTPIHAEATFMVAKGYPDTWRSNATETPLGGMTALGVHCLDTFHYLLGPTRRVSAFSNPVITDQPLHHATGLLLEFDSGAVATLSTSHFAPAANRTAIYGSAGAAFNEDDGARLFLQKREDPTRYQIAVDKNNEIVEQINEFALTIRGRATIETGGAEGLAVVNVLEAAIASAASGQATAVATTHQLAR